MVQETLLVVENETAIRALVNLALERHGYTVLSAESGSEAPQPRCRATMAASIF